MGQAFIGLADDVTCVWWNPAGLAQMEGREIFFSWPYDANRRHASQSLRNLPFPSKEMDFLRINPTEPLELGSNSFSMYPIEPSFGIYLGKFRGFAIALSSFASAGAGTDWKDRIGASNGDIIASKAHQIFFNLNFTLSIAKEILPNLYLGVNINRVSGQLDFVKTKSYFPLPHSHFQGYTSEIQWEGSGSTFSFDGGLLFRPHRRLRIGFIFRGSYDIPFKGTAKFIDTVFGGMEASRFIEEFHFPIKYGIGFSLSLSDRLRILFDLYRPEWNNFKINLNFSGMSRFFRNRDIDLDLKDLLEYRFGIEYDVNDAFTLRMGFQNAPSFHNGNPNLSIVDFRLNSSGGGITFGLGYRIKGLVIDTYFIYPFFRERNIWGVDYQEEFFETGVTLRYKF